MIAVVIETKVYQKNQITIPKKKITLNEMIGAGKKVKNTNAVKLEEKLYKI